MPLKKLKGLSFKITENKTHISSACQKSYNQGSYILEQGTETSLEGKTSVKTILFRIWLVMIWYAHCEFYMKSIKELGQYQVYSPWPDLRRNIFCSHLIKRKIPSIRSIWEEINTDMLQVSLPSLQELVFSVINWHICKYWILSIISTDSGREDVWKTHRFL